MACPLTLVLLAAAQDNFEPSDLENHSCSTSRVLVELLADELAVVGMAADTVPAENSHTVVKDHDAG